MTTQLVSLEQVAEAMNQAVNEVGAKAKADASPFDVSLATTRWVYTALCNEVQKEQAAPPRGAASKTAKVTVRLVVEVNTSATWGEDCSVGQVRSQGSQAALNALSDALFGDGKGRGRFRIVSQTACDMVVPLGESKP